MQRNANRPAALACAALLFAPLLAAAPARAAGGGPPPGPSFGADQAARFVQLALDCARREYPNHVSHLLHGDADALPPRELTPAFYGCYDWHSAVHGHWLLARAARTWPRAPFAAGARAVLEADLTSANIAREVAYLSGDGRSSFERPYGLAWLLELGRELHEWDDPDARRWAAALEPLERLAVQRVSAWLPNLRYPMRIGEHGQTAFALGLMLDWARSRGDGAFAALIERRARGYFLADRACPLAYEPSGEDFLSPCLGEADLVRRVLGPLPYARWLRGFLPALGAPHWLAPAVVTDRSDPRLAHLDGLNLSRAWMLEGIAAGLPPGDRRVAGLRAAALAHRQAALPAISGEHYEGGHWLGSFATYLVTGAGLPAPRP